MHAKGGQRQIRIAGKVRTSTVSNELALERSDGFKVTQALRNARMGSDQSSGLLGGGKPLELIRESAYQKRISNDDEQQR